jgi:DinB superfamily
MMVTDDMRARILSYIRQEASKTPEEIAELVAASQNQFLAKIAGVSDDVAATKPSADEWSLRELIRHVILAEASFTRMVEALARGDASVEDALPAAGSMLDDDGRSFAEYVAQLRGTNTYMLDTIRGLRASSDLTTTGLHPMLGPLNCVEWAVAQRVHDVDHVQHAGKLVVAG